MIDSAVITRLATRGDGVTADRRHIPGAVPGDLVDADGVITVRGPNRAEPSCLHFGRCGGCQLQHVAEPLLCLFARDRILDALAAVGLQPGEVLPTHLSAPGTRRRAAMRATRRQGAVRLGFNAPASHSIVDLAQCPVLRPDLFALVEPLRTLIGPYLGEGAAIAVTLTATDHGPDLLLSNLQARGLPRIEGLTAFARRHGLVRLAVDGPDGVETLIADGAPSVAFGGVAVVLPPGAFLQATADGEAALLAAVRSIVTGARRIADLFCGLGTFALPLSDGARVVAADAAGAATAALERAARSAARPVEVVHRDLFRRPFDTADLKGIDAVVFDPPRAGAQAQVAALARSDVGVVAAVSCNPATFARDARILADAGFRLLRLWPVAQFRWSTHVELVAEFRR
jgi:23S rRNA (uracil1939-C5)-methyltransferase